MVDLQEHALTLLVHRCGWLALIALISLLTALTLQGGKYSHKSGCFSHGPVVQ